ncbi:MAG: phosphatidylglycerophosphatase A [bacterium]
MNLNKFCFEIATFHGLGKSWLGRILAPVFAFPILFLFRFLFDINPNFFYWFLIAVLVIIFSAVTIALRSGIENVKSKIVLDEIVGLMIAFLMIPFRFKLMIFGYILFFIINFLRYPLFKSYLGSKLDNLPGALGVFSGSILSGFLTNLFMQLVLWVVY